MAQANSNYSFSISSEDVAVLGAHPKSGLATVVIQGLCEDKDGNVFHFAARNNLDLRYPERFKVNWNGSKARMPEVAGLGFDDESREGKVISDDLYMTRGARIAIARQCIALYPQPMQFALATGSDEPAAVEEVAEEVAEDVAEEEVSAE